MSEREGHISAVVVLVIGCVVALGIRIFIFEPYRIPSASMVPTLRVGDHLIVAKYAYGVRLPLSRSRILPLGDPERGDVIVFRFPDDPSQDFIKRVVGLPGDRVRMVDSHVEVNGEIFDQLAEGEFEYMDYELGRKTVAKRFRERNPDGREYTILRSPGDRGEDRGPWEVPAGHYFVLGDNRDHSKDSRSWERPFVPSAEVQGRANWIYWSWVVAGGSDPKRSAWQDFVHTFSRIVRLDVEELRWERAGRAIDGPAD